MFSARHEFAAEWYRFLHPNPNDATQELALDLSKERFPFPFRNRSIAIASVQAVLKLETQAAQALYDGGTSLTATLLPGPAETPVAAAFAPKSLFGQLPRAVFANFSSDAPGPDWKLTLASADIRKIPLGLREQLTVEGQPRDHLLPEVVEDIWLLCHYSAA
jgi:hypothetical protein